MKKKEIEVRKYLAKSYEMLGETENAIEEYKKLKELNMDKVELEQIYLKLEELYDGTEQFEEAWDICRESVEKLPESEKMWVTYIKRYCEDGNIEREVCAEMVKKAVQEIPELEESVEFQELKEEYIITIDGDKVSVGNAENETIP